MMTQSTDQLLAENEALRRRLDELEDTLRAIRSGEVDAVVVEAGREQVFTLETADRPYRLLVEQMPHGAATLTVEGVLLYCNRHFADLLKQPLQALLGKPISNFIHGDSRRLFEALLRDGQAGDVQGEVILERADGTPVPAYLGVNALQEGALGLCLVVTDLTEQQIRKKAELFADRVARLQQVTAALSEAITVDDVAEVIVTHGLAALGATVGVVAMLNEEGTEFVNLRVVGYPAEVVANWTRSPADAALPMADAVRTGQPIVVESLAEQRARYPDLARLRPDAGDGALVAFPLLVHGRAIGALRLHFPTSHTLQPEEFDYMQTLAQQCAQALDRARMYDAERRARERAEQEIEERTRAEESLRESDLRFRNLLLALPAAVYTTDREGLITLFNEQAAKLWGRRPEIGKDMWCGSWRIYRPDGTPLPLGECPMAIALREGRGVQGQEIVIERPDGTRVCVLPYPEPLRDASGVVVGAVNMLVDITDRKRAEDALKEADRRKNEFLATLAHELRNPLAPILNALHLMQLRGLDDPDLQSSREIILRQTQTLNRLVDDLLDVSRITRGKVLLRLQSLDLSSVIHRAVETSQPAIDANHHHLSVTLPPESIRLRADPTRLAQVFANLLNNAAKYMEPGGRIWLTAEPAGTEVAVRVRDAGVGIPQDMLPKVFDLFTQVDRSVDRSEGGLGIGLSLVQSLVQMHGGSVSAFSAGPGKGSEFVVRLPVLTDASKEIGGAAVSKAQANGPVLRILVVDDNVDAAKSLGMLLRCQGHEVTVVHDGLMALDATNTRTPDLILLDIGLPGLDGFEVCRRLRQVPELQQTMLVALTGYGQEEDRRRSQEAGFHAHMVKPLELDLLQDLLAHAAYRPAARSR